MYNLAKIRELYNNKIIKSIVETLKDNSTAISFELRKMNDK